MTGTLAPAVAAVRVHPEDTVAVAVRALDAGADVLGVRLAGAVPAGHKLALVAHAAGEPVVKYGVAIGRATAAIRPGEHVHSHNLRTALDGEDVYAYRPQPPALPDPGPEPTWQGYVRPDGRTATRNELWVLNTVGCVNRASERIARQAEARWGPDGAGLIDGARAFVHPFGCSQLGGDLDRTRDVLAALARHPTCGGVLALGLGCENNRLDGFLAAVGRTDGRVRAFATQAVGDEIAAGLDAAEELVREMSADRRETLPASRLVVAVKCGGSDGFSGVTANPLLGRLADRWAAWGGRVVMSEVPEMFGAEAGLLARAADAATFDALAGALNRFKRYYLDHGQPVYENPSPGNKDGGLTTLEEKSLGAVQKGGRAPVAEVVAYAGQASVPGMSGFRPGLAIVEAPGNDGVSSTAMTAAGAGVLLFTTGRGTPLGFPVPTLKVASNSDLAARKPHWIDVDAGALLAGDDADALTDRLVATVLATASGAPARNELNDDREIAIWKDGVTL